LVIERQAQPSNTSSNRPASSSLSSQQRSWRLAQHRNWRIVLKRRVGHGSSNAHAVPPEPWRNLRVLWPRQLADARFRVAGVSGLVVVESVSGVVGWCVT